MSPRSRRAVRSPALRARDAGLQRLHQLTVGAAVLGAVGTVALGGAAAVTYAGHASPTSSLSSQAGSTGGGATSASGSSGAASTITGDGEHHHHSTTPVPLGQLTPSRTGVTPGSPGSGLVTSGGS